MFNHYRGLKSSGNLDHKSSNGFTECLYSTTPFPSVPAAARSFLVVGRSEMIYAIGRFEIAYKGALGRLRLHTRVH